MHPMRLGDERGVWMPCLILLPYTNMSEGLKTHYRGACPHCNQVIIRWEDSSSQRPYNVHRVLHCGRTFTLDRVLSWTSHASGVYNLKQFLQERGARLNAVLLKWELKEQPDTPGWVASVCFSANKMQIDISGDRSIVPSDALASAIHNVLVDDSDIPYSNDLSTTSKPKPNDLPLCDDPSPSA